MQPTIIDLQNLGKAIAGKDIDFVKKFVAEFGVNYLMYSINKYPTTQLYGDMHNYYYIHTAIDNEDMAMLEYFKSVGFYAKVNYVIESNFNSKADQFMNREEIDLLTYTKRKASEKVVSFVEEWLKDFKK